MSTPGYTPTLEHRWFRFSLKTIVALTLGCAIVTNMALAQPTKELASIVRLLIAAVFLVGGTSYLALQFQRMPIQYRWIAYAAWAVTGWGVILVFCSSSYLIGSTLFKVLESR
jgi:hypothetical protein